MESNSSRTTTFNYRAIVYGLRNRNSYRILQTSKAPLESQVFEAPAYSRAVRRVRGVAQNSSWKKVGVRFPEKSRCLANTRHIRGIK